MSDWFIDVIASRVTVVEEMLKKYNSVIVIPSWIRDQKSVWWIRKDLVDYKDKDEIAAIDGGGGYADLLGGGGFYIARAVAVYSNSPSLSRELLIDVVKYRARGYLDILRILAEIRVAKKAVHRLSPNSILLMDGSLYTMLNYLFAKFFKMISRPDRISLGEFYLLDRTVEALIELIELIESVDEKDILIAFVSKDSTLKVLKEYLAYMFFSEKYPKLAELMRNYPITNRKIFLRIYRETEDTELKSMLNLILDTGYKDVQMILDLTGSEKGYTKPLLLGALTEPSKRLRDKNYVKQLLSETISIYPFRDKQEEFNNRVETLIRKIDSLKTPILSYLKVSEREPPLMVEVLYHRNIIETIGTRKFVNETPYFNKIVKILNRDYKNRKYYNLWLVYAHNYAKLSRKQFLYYIRYIEALLSRKHIRIPFTRRYSLEA